MVTKRKTFAQLDREIAEVLVKGKGSRSRTYHTTRRDVSDDDWDVAMDAIMERDAKKAARVVHHLRHEYGFVTEPKEFTDALIKSPTNVWLEFQRHYEELEATDPKPTERYESHFTLLVKQPSGKITETNFRSARPMSERAARERIIATKLVDPHLMNRPVSGGWHLRVPTNLEIDTDFEDAKPFP